MTYRDDDSARTQRANALIDEIAGLERDQLAHATRAERLETARRELSTLQAATATTSRAPGLTTHLVVFTASAVFACIGYTLLR